MPGPIGPNEMRARQQIAAALGGGQAAQQPQAAPSPWQQMQPEPEAPAQDPGIDLMSGWQQAQLQGPTAQAAFLKAHPELAAQLQGQ